MFDLVQWAQSVRPSWAEEPIKPWDEKFSRDVASFVSSETWTDLDAVNVFSVVGTRNSRYYNWTWQHLLANGKRMANINLPLFVENPGYYDEVGRKDPPMSFKTYDGEQLFVDADGNHRTCIAKFAFARVGKTQLHGVTVRRLTIDHALMAMRDEMVRLCHAKQLQSYIEVDQIILGREDSPGWKVDRFQPVIVVRDSKSGEKLKTCDLAGAKQWVSDNSRSFFQKLLNRSAR